MTLFGILTAGPVWRSDIAMKWQTVNERRSLLIVDDDVAVLRLLGVLFDLDYQVTTVTSAAAALEQLSSYTPDAIILDLEMPTMNGRMLFQELRRRGIKSPVMILS